MSKTHEANVTTQFGPRAAAYVASAVHASGEDLTQIAALAQARPPAKALDLGCGGGHVSFSVAPYAGEVIAFDLSHDMLTALAISRPIKAVSNAFPSPMARLILSPAATARTTGTTSPPD